VTCVLFVDVDGVLATPRTRPVGTLDPALVARLDRLCREAGAVVVISSSWRAMGLETLRALFDRAGFTGAIVGATPDLGAAATRGEEIAAWHLEHGPTDYAILDDDAADMGDLLPRLIRTRTTVGLSEEDVARALALLDGEA
jgi:hypothetical protein